MCNIPLLEIPLALIEKYKDNSSCIENGTILPTISNQRFNSYLKELADICGIEKHLTSHTASKIVQKYKSQCKSNKILDMVTNDRAKENSLLVFFSRSALTNELEPSPCGEGSGLVFGEGVAKLAIYLFRSFEARALLVVTAFAVVDILHLVDIV